MMKQSQDAWWDRPPGLSIRAKLGRGQLIAPYSCISDGRVTWWARSPGKAPSRLHIAQLAIKRGQLLAEIDDVQVHLPAAVCAGITLRRLHRSEEHTSELQSLRH